MRFDPGSGSSSVIGVGLGSDPGKWRSAVLGNDGSIYGIPYNSERVLRIDPSVDSVELIGACFAGNGKWWGGTCAGDGRIYCVPCYGNHVLCIEPASRTAAFVGENVTQKSGCAGGAKWVSAGLGLDGRMYCIPREAHNVLCFDPTTRTSLFLDVDADIRGGRHKWGGSAVTACGRIYGAPRNASAVLRIDTERTSCESEQVCVCRASDSAAYMEDGCKAYGAVTGADGVAVFKDAPFMTSAGPCTVKSIRGGSVN